MRRSTARLDRRDFLKRAAALGASAAAPIGLLGACGGSDDASSDSNPRELHDLHFDLSSAPVAEPRLFALRSASHGSPLKVHDAESRARHRASNVLLAGVPDAQLTHYIENADLPAKALQGVLVMGKHHASAQRILATAHIFVPNVARRSVAERAAGYPSTTPGSWATLIPMVDLEGRPVLDEAGEPVYRYDLDDGIAKATGDVVKIILKDIFDDPLFEGMNWHAPTGLATHAASAATASSFAGRGVPASSGLSVAAAHPPGSVISGIGIVDLQVTDAATRTVQLTVKNNYLRYLMVYAEFRDSNVSAAFPDGQRHAGLGLSARCVHAGWQAPVPHARSGGSPRGGGPVSQCLHAELRNDCRSADAGAVAVAVVAGDAGSLSGTGTGTGVGRQRVAHLRCSVLGRLSGGRP